MIQLLFKRRKEQTGWVRTIFRIGLGVFLLFAGTSHLTFQREEFLAQVPLWVPWEGDLVVVLSGLVEITLGAALVLLSGLVEITLGAALVLLPGYQVLIGWMVAAFFIAIFPGNVSQYLNGIDAFGLNTDRARLIRLFFQPLLVLWALWSTEAWHAWRTAQR